VAANFSALKGKYELLFDSCLIRPERSALVDQAAARVVASRGRYQAVGKKLGTPWYVVGLIHTLEAGGDFTRHLHNGDPLSARTTHWPPGRPKTGSPPFTWEESAVDALTLQSFPAWKDWSVPGVLYKLELYNGTGYLDFHPEVNTPYLWSFTNQYTRGKYVADRKYDANAVSQQCGAAAVLKRLAEDGTVQLEGLAPRPVLQLTNPYMTGADVEDAQTLLAANPYGNFMPGVPDGEFGPVTADAVERAKLALGYLQKQVDGVYGPVLKAYLSSEKPLPGPYQKRREQRLAAGSDEDAIRAKIVANALWGVKNKNSIAYSQGPNRLAALGTPQSLPLATDCSAFATLCYAWAGAPNPNFEGPYKPTAGGYTGTLLEHLRHVPRSAVKPGDLVVWTPPADGRHAAVVVGPGADPWLVSHGSDAGPAKVRLSAEHAVQRRNGHGTMTFLSAFA